MVDVGHAPGRLALGRGHDQLDPRRFADLNRRQQFRTGNLVGMFAERLIRGQLKGHRLLVLHLVPHFDLVHRLRRVRAEVDNHLVIVLTEGDLDLHLTIVQTQQVPAVRSVGRVVVVRMARGGIVIVIAIVMVVAILMVVAIVVAMRLRVPIGHRGGFRSVGAVSTAGDRAGANGQPEHDEQSAEEVGA